MSELKFGDKVEIVAGRFKGSVGIVRNIQTITQVQVDFIGVKKTVPIENIISCDSQVTSLIDNSPHFLD